MSEHGDRTVALDLDLLWRVASAADRGGREWTWKGGYPQTILRVGDVGLIANTYDEPDERACTAEYVATFDPPTVLALLRKVAEGA